MVPACCDHITGAPTDSMVDHGKLNKIHNIKEHIIFITEDLEITIESLTAVKPTPDSPPYLFPGGCFLLIGLSSMV